MTRVTLDANLASRLSELGQVVELCDPGGRIVGRFLPAVETEMSEWEPITPEVSEEELDRRAQQGDWVTTAEVLARLESREGS